MKRVLPPVTAPFLLIAVAVSIALSARARAEQPNMQLDMCSSLLPKYRMVVPQNSSVYSTGTPVEFGLQSEYDDTDEQNVSSQTLALLDETGERYGSAVPLHRIFPDARLPKSGGARDDVLLGTDPVTIPKLGKYRVYVVVKEPNSSPCPGEHSILAGTVTFGDAAAVRRVAEMRRAMEVMRVRQARRRLSLTSPAPSDSVNLPPKPEDTFPESPPGSVPPAASGGTPSLPSLPTIADSEAQKQFAEVYRAIEAAEVSGRNESILKYYASDAIVFTANNAPASSTEIPRVLYSRIVAAAYGIAYERETPLEVSVRDRWASDIEDVAIGIYPVKLPGRDASLTVHLCALTIWERKPDLGWRISRQAFTPTGDPTNNTPCTLTSK